VSLASPAAWVAASVSAVAESLISPVLVLALVAVEAPVPVRELSEVRLPQAAAVLHFDSAAAVPARAVVV